MMNTSTIYYSACLPLFMLKHYIPSHNLRSSDSKLFVPHVQSTHALVLVVLL